jgi:CIC family chloride channel protein
LAIGSGLVLGREGPTIHIGASIGHLLAKISRCNEHESRVLLAAGAGAGLATAFNAPIAGAVFVLEELVGVFDMDVTIATIGATPGAISVARVFLGQNTDFHIAPLDFPGFGSIPAYVVLGILLGFLGVLYNRAILSALAFSAKLTMIRVEWRAALIGAAIGVLTWFLPGLVGGSQAGLLFGILWCRWLNAYGLQPREFALVGMAAFFGAVVRSPIKKSPPGVRAA